MCNWLPEQARQPRKSIVGAACFQPPRKSRQGNGVTIMRLLSFLLLAGASSACWAIVPEDITFQATFDGTLQARSARGSGEPQTVGEFRFAPGRRGQGVVVGKDGNSLSYAVAENVTLPEGSISVWVQPIDWYGADGMFHIFFDASSSGGRLLVYEYGPGVTLLFYVLNAKRHDTNAPAPMPREVWTPGSWHHLVATWQPGEVAFYSDGKLASRITDRDILPSDLGERFQVGTNTGWKPITGRDDTVLDDLTLYNRALLPDEVAGLYRGEEFPNAEPLHLAVAPYPVAGTVGARIDARGTYDIPLDELSAHVALTKAKRDEVIEEAARPLKAREDEIELSTEGLRVGPYEIHVTLLRGKEPFAKANASFWVHPKPEWWQNTLGVTREVPPPWTPLKVEGDSVSCWGRRYDFVDSPILGQIESQGREILAGPVELRAEVGGRGGRARALSGRFGEKSPDRVIYQASGALGALALSACATVEFDGFAKFDLTLTPPAGPVRVNSLSMVIPLKPEHAQLMVRHGFYISGIETAGEVPKNGFACPFTPFVLLSDNDRGLCWCTESDQYWYADDQSRGRQIELVRVGGRVELRLNFINAPTEVKSPIRYVFALQATPVKPFPPDYRRMRMATPARPPGNIAVPWSGWSTLPSYPVPVDAKAMDEEYRKTPEILKCPYMCLQCVASESKEFLRYGEEWKMLPEWHSAEQWPRRPMTGVNPGSGWGDFLIWGLDRLAKSVAIGGIYLDIAEPTKSRNFRHGAGWQDESGVWHPTGDIFAERECLKRLYHVFLQQGRRMLIILHQSGHVSPPTMAFADIYCTGEQLSSVLRQDYFDIVPLDFYRAACMGRQWGIVTAFLPMWGVNPHSKAENKAEEIRHALNTIALVSLHDCQPWNSYFDNATVDKWWLAQDEFGITDAEFVPYWDNGKLVEGLPETIKVSAYVRPGGAFVTVTNVAKDDQTIALRLRPEALGGDPAMAKDVFSDEAVPVRDGAIELTVPGRLCRIVVVSAGTG
jgi:hypothetical protein